MGSADFAPAVQAAQPAQPAPDAYGPVTNGPAADYPMVIGEPYTVEGELYTPSDTLNYDEVGYASADSAGGLGISASHRTLPLPSYVEVTSLESGQTILVRVERRGPMTGNGLIALSSAAQAQLGLNASTPVRVRRTNPPEVERAELRMGGFVQPRLETPQSLVQILRERLPANGSASLRSAEAPPIPSSVSPDASPIRTAQSTPVSPSAPVRVTRAPTQVVTQMAGRGVAAATPARAANPIRPSFDQTYSDSRRVSTAYPLSPLPNARAATPTRYASNGRVAPRGYGSATSSRPSPVVVSSMPVPRAARPTVRSTPTPVRIAQAPQQAPDGRFVIQAGAFSNQSNASRVANGIGGFVERAGRFYRVRKGPYTTRGQAEAALAKLRADGYSEARVFTSG